MIKYSKPRIVLLIILLAALWALSWVTRPGVWDNFDIPSGSGAIRIDTTDNAATVFADSEHKMTVGLAEGSELVCSGPGGTSTIGRASGTRLDAAEWTISIPSWVDELMISGTGGFEVADLGLDLLDISCMDGDVALESSQAGELGISVASGDISILDTRAQEASVSVASGDITIGPGDMDSLSVNAAAGDVDIDLTGKDSVEVSLASGDILCRVPDRSGWTLQIKDSLGSRTVGAGPKTASLETLAGDVAIEIANP